MQINFTFLAKMTII